MTLWHWKMKNRGALIRKQAKLQERTPVTVAVSENSTDITAKSSYRKYRKSLYNLGIWKIKIKINQNNFENIVKTNLTSKTQVAYTFLSFFLMGNIIANKLKLSIVLMV